MTVLYYLNAPVLLPAHFVNLTTGNKYFKSSIDIKIHMFIKTTMVCLTFNDSSRPSVGIWAMSSGQSQP